MALSLRRPTVTEVEPAFPLIPAGDSSKRRSVLRSTLKRLKAHHHHRRFDLVHWEQAQLYNPKGQEDGDWMPVLAELHAVAPDSKTEQRVPLVAVWQAQPTCLVAVFTSPFRVSCLDKDVRLFKDADVERGNPGLCFILRCQNADCAVRLSSKVQGLQQPRDAAAPAPAAAQAPAPAAPAPAQPPAAPVSPRSPRSPKCTHTPSTSSSSSMSASMPSLPVRVRRGSGPITVRVVDESDRRWDVAMPDKATVAWLLEEVVHKRLRGVPTMYALAFSQPRHRTVCTASWLVEDKGVAALSTFGGETLYLIKKKGVKFDDAFSDWVSGFDTRASALTVLRHWASFSVRRREQMLPILEDTVSLLVEEHVQRLYDIAQRQSLLPCVKLRPFRLHEVGDAVEINWPDVVTREVEVINSEQQSDVLAYIVCPHIEGFRVSCMNPLLFVPAKSSAKFTLNFGAAHLPDGGIVADNPECHTIRVQYHVLTRGEAAPRPHRVGSLDYMERPLTPLFLRFKLKAKFTARVGAPGVPLRVRELTPDQLRARVNVLRVIGRGGCGTVSLVKLDDQVMAMKTFTLPPKDDALLAATRHDLIEDFKAELAVVDDHPNIIPLHHFTVDLERDQLHIMMPYLELGDLSHLALDQSQPFPWPLRLKIALDVASALAHLHRRAICHRDLKPENVLVASTTLDPDWQSTAGKPEHANALLSDFGCVSEIAKAEMRNAWVGTSPYKAPEAIPVPGQKQLERSYAPPCDVYAFGIMLYVIAARTPPYEAAGRLHPSKLEQLVQEGFRPSLEALPPDAPAWIPELLQNCWKSDPDKRPKMDAVVEEIHAGLCALLEVSAAAAGVAAPSPAGPGSLLSSGGVCSPVRPASPMQQVVPLRVACSCHERVLQVQFGTALAALLETACAKVFGAGDAAAMRLCNASSLAVIASDEELAELMRAETVRSAAEDTPALLLCPKRDVAEVLLRPYRFGVPLAKDDPAAPAGGKVLLAEVHRAATCAELCHLAQHTDAVREALAARGVAAPFAVVSASGAVHPDEWQPLRFSAENRETVLIASQKEAVESMSTSGTFEVNLRRSAKEAHVPVPAPPPGTAVTVEDVLRCAGAPGHLVVLPNGISAEVTRRLRPRDGPLLLVPASSADLVGVSVKYGGATWNVWALGDVRVGDVTQAARAALGASVRAAAFDKDGPVDDEATLASVADREWRLAVPPETVMV
eukprot:m51a1_g7183 putative serine-threonine protein (1211) ;mRNA; f:85537-89918